MEEMGDIESQNPINSINNNDSEIGSSAKDFKVLCELGKGASAVVYKVQSLKNNKIYVLKKLELKKLKSRFEYEVNILKKIESRYIIKYYTSFIEAEQLSIIMEFAEGGDLYSYMKTFRNKKTYISEDALWMFAYQTLLGLDYLHSNKIIHRDIKLLNILLDADLNIKIGDLGVSKLVSSLDNLQKSRVGTPLYLAPELIKQIPYDFKIDIWSLGCSLYHLASFEPPFNEENLVVLGAKIVQSEPKELSESYSSMFKSFITKLLSKDANQRPTAKEALSMIPLGIKVSYSFLNSFCNLI